MSGKKERSKNHLLGDRVLQRLYKLNMKQNELAKKLGIAESTLNQWISYKREARVSDLVNISNALNVITQKLLH